MGLRGLLWIVLAGGQVGSPCPPGGLRVNMLSSLDAFSSSPVDVTALKGVTKAKSIVGDSCAELMSIVASAREVESCSAGDLRMLIASTEGNISIDSGGTITHGDGTCRALTPDGLARLRAFREWPSVSEEDAWSADISSFLKGAVGRNEPLMVSQCASRRSKAVAKYRAILVLSPFNGAGLFIQLRNGVEWDVSTVALRDGDLVVDRGLRGQQDQRTRDAMAHVLLAGEFRLRWPSQLLHLKTHIPQTKCEAP
jgi:hypothetical protein